MKGKKFLPVIAAAIVLAGAVLLSGSAASENGQQPSAEPAAAAAEEAKPACDYSYLRGTMYKSLYVLKYENLYKTTIKPVVAEEGSGEGGGSGGWSGGTAIGSAGNPGYSGSGGTYSLKDYTVAAHLTVMGTSCGNGKPPQRRAFSKHRNLRSQLGQLLCSLQKDRRRI